MAPAFRPALASAPLSLARRAKRGLVVLPLLLAAALAGGAEGPESKPAQNSKDQSKKDKPPVVRGLDKLKLPPNAIVVICNEKEGLGLLPKSVWLTPAQYRKLKERIADL